MMTPNAYDAEVTPPITKERGKLLARIGDAFIPVSHGRDGGERKVKYFPQVPALDSNEAGRAGKSDQQHEGKCLDELPLLNRSGIAGPAWMGAIESRHETSHLSGAVASPIQR
jgi:hypothetical protein